MEKKRKNVRAFGHKIEVFYMNIFRDELDFEFCKTSRNFSRVLDACKIDLSNIPYNIQIKAGEQRGLNPNKLMYEMEKLLKENYPPNDILHTLPKVVIHYKLVEKGRKNRIPEDEIVYLPLSEYVSYYKSLNFSIIIKEIKKTKLKSLRDTKYGMCVGITFKDFKEEIVKKLTDDKNINKESNR